MTFVRDLLVGMIFTLAALAVVLVGIAALGVAAYQVGVLAENRGWDGGIFFSISFLVMLVVVIGGFAFALSERDEL